MRSQQETGFLKQLKMYVLYLECHFSKLPQDSTVIVGS